MKTKRKRTMKFIKGAVLILAFLSLQSCFVAKEYTRPETDVESQSFRTDQLPQDSLSMATISWKEIFTDPILQGYIDEGLKNNIDIRVALQQIQMAEAYVNQGKASYFPTLNGNARYTHQELPAINQFGNISSISQYELSAGLSWEADIWGKIRS